jgi:ATP synthase protein I
MGELFRQLLRASTVGIELVAATVVGGLIGYLLDELFEVTKPWLFIVFLLLGIAAGFRQLFRLTREARQNSAGKENP